VAIATPVPFAAVVSTEKTVLETVLENVCLVPLGTPLQAIITARPVVERIQDLPPSVQLANKWATTTVGAVETAMGPALHARAGFHLTAAITVSTALERLKELKPRVLRAQ